MPNIDPEDVIVGPNGIGDRAGDPDAPQTIETGPEPAAATPPPKLDANALLQSLASGATDPMSLLLSQISANAPNDPSVGMMSSLLQRRDPPAPEIDEEAQAEAAAKLEELSSLVEKLYAEVETLRSRSVVIAAALGACYVCFGADLLCPHCGGRGRPGSCAPRPEAYRAYVAPAVMRVRHITEAQRRNGPPVPARAAQAPHFPVQGANNG